MDIRRVFKNLNLFVDGKSYAGNVVDYHPPKVKIKNETFRGGGMDGEVDLTMGIEKLTAEFTIKDYDPDLIGLVSPREGANRSLVMRGYCEDWNGKISPVVAILRGKATEVDRGNIKPGGEVNIKVTMTLDYYSEEIDGDMALEIDVMNAVYVEAGKDMLADARSALGI